MVLGHAVVPLVLEAERARAERIAPLVCMLACAISREPQVTVTVTLKWATTLPPSSPWVLGPVVTWSPSGAVERNRDRDVRERTREGRCRARAW